jgi:hypothetical protein
MKAASRMLLLSLKVRVRLTSAWSWLFIAIGAVLVPSAAFSLGRVVGTISIVPQDLLPFLTGFLNVLLFLQIGAAFSSAFYHLYLSRDLPLLLASPSRPRSVILAKMLEVAGSGIAAYIAAGVPLLVSLGKAWYAPSWYYILAAVAGLPFAMLPAVLAILANLVVCRILPPYRSKEITAALGTLAGALTYLFFRVAGSSEVWGQAKDPSAVSLFFGRLGPSWSPSSLLAKAVIEGLHERWLPLLSSGVLLSVAVFGLFALVVAGTEKAYLSGWAASREGRRGRKNHPMPDGPVPDSPVLDGGSGRALPTTSDQASGDAWRPTSDRTWEGALRPAPVHASGPASDYARPASGVTRDEKALTHDSPLSVELKALSVESKLLFRDLQSQSQVLYVLVMVLAMQLFPGRGGATVDDWWFPLIPFFFLAMGGSYASWSLKNMPQTAQMLRQFPCDPARVMRGKAFFYGIIQSVCIALLVGVLRVLGRFTVGNLPVLGILWIALSFATSATTVTAAAYKPLIPQATGIPRLDLGVGIALFLVNGALAAISGVTYMLGAVRSLNYPSALWTYAGLAVVANAVVFVVATNMAGKMIRGTSPAESPGAEGSK